jgi:hypothetical protein
MAETVDTSAPEKDEKDGKRDPKDIIDECRKLIEFVVSTDGDNRSAAVDDLEFLSGNQWPDEISRARDADDRPMITVNTLPTYIRQVTNDQRQNKGAIKTHPVDEEADPDTAEVIQGFIRHIEYDSNADVAYDTAVNSAASNGFGWFRLITEYADEKSFNQDIKFRRIRNPLTVFPGYHEQPDGSDLKQLAISIKIKTDEFKRLYPNADMAGFSQLGPEWADWRDDQFIRVAEYYRIEYEDAEVVLLSNGESGFKDKLIELPPGVTVVKTRKGQRSKVIWSKLTAVEELESTEIKADRIPVFPVYGDEIDINGRVIRSGLIRHAKDPVRMNNYWLTKATEEVALRGLSPYVGAEGQFEGHPEWEEANNRAYAYLEYVPKSFDGILAPPPQRQPMADVPTGTLAMAMHAAQNVQQTIGIFNAGLGEKSNETSGKAILARQREGDVGTFHYTDNLNLARKAAGRCIISMLPYYYDTERGVRILGEDGKASTVTLNQRNTTKKKSKDGIVRDVLNNVCAGKYDVTVTSGPSYTTARTEAAEYLTQVAQGAKDPATSAVATYLAIKNSDVPGSEQAIKMMEKLPSIAPLLEPEQGEEGEEMIQTPKGPIPASKAGEAIAGMDAALHQAEAALQEAGLLEKQNKARELDIKEKEVEVKAQEVAVKQFEAETNRAEAEADALRAQADVMKAEAEAASIRLKAEVEANCTHEESKANAEATRMKAGAEVAKSQAETVIPQASPKGMVIKAPSGQVYEVGLT